MTRGKYQAQADRRRARTESDLIVERDKTIAALTTELDRYRHAGHQQRIAQESWNTLTRERNQLAAHVADIEPELDALTKWKALALNCISELHHLALGATVIPDDLERQLAIVDPDGYITRLRRDIPISRTDRRVTDRNIRHGRLPAQHPDDWLETQGIKDGSIEIPWLNDYIN